MKISVIIPCHNHASLVSEAVASALGQSLLPDEIIVVDDGSEDDVKGALSGFGDKVRLIRQERKGSAAARNRAVQEASGDWLAFLDADDLWLKDKLKVMAAALGRMKEVDMAHSDGWVIEGPLDRESLNKLPTFFSGRVPPAGDGALDIFLASNPLLTSSVMMRTEVYRSLGGMDESLAICHDADLFLRALARGCRLEYTPLPLMVQRCSPGGLGANQLRRMDESIVMLDKAGQEFPALAGRIRPGLKRACSVAAWYAMREGRADMARHYWLRSLGPGRRGPRDLLTAFYLFFGPWGLGKSRRMWSEVIEKLTLPR